MTLMLAGLGEGIGGVAQLAQEQDEEMDEAEAAAEAAAQALDAAAEMARRKRRDDLNELAELNARVREERSADDLSKLTVGKRPTAVGAPANDEEDLTELLMQGVGSIKCRSGRHCGDGNTGDGRGGIDGWRAINGR